MKKIIVVLIALVAINLVSAQEKEKSFLDKRNEVKLNLPTTIFGAFPEVSYERILQEDLSVGASMGINVEKERDRDNFVWMKFQFTPYFRWFFGGNAEAMQKYAAGFFIEANASVFQRSENVSWDGQDFFDKYWGFGAGVAVGWKYVTKNGWVGDVFFGLGKDFSGKGADAYPRMGICIGKRF